jgi:hypothetical protein
MVGAYGTLFSVQTRAAENPARPFGSALAGGSGAAPAVSVERNSIGLPILKISYPWNRHTRPSLQIALMKDPQADSGLLEPLAIPGEAAVALWSSQVKRLHQPIFPSSTATVGTTSALLEFDSGKRLLTVRGSDNALKKPAAYGYEEKDGSRAVFYLLEQWLDSRGNFQLDLSDVDLLPKFAEKGQLRLWLLDREKVVWTQTVAWPGKETEKAGAKSPPADPLPKKPEPMVDKPKVETTTASQPAKIDRPGNSPGTVVDVRPPASPEKASPLKPAESEPRLSPLPPAKLAPSGAQLAPTPLATVPAPAAKTPVSTPAGPASTSVLGPAASGGKSVVAKPETSSVASTPKKTPSGSPRVEEMNIDELADYIEHRWGETMSAEVRRSWLGGWHNYYRVSNPEPVRRVVFMSLLITCFKAQPSGELRDAFAMLYWKLKRLGS